MGVRLQRGLIDACASHGVTATVPQIGSMISVFFTEGPVTNYDAAETTDRAFFGRLFHALLSRGVYLPPSALESWFMNLAMTASDVDATIDAFAAALKEIL
jgi:glutamate-1-semialdehyde 2,1-aminomutase